MRKTLMLVIAAVALLCACDFFDTSTVVNKANNERKLKELQWALLIPASSPPAVPSTALPGETPAATTTAIGAESAPTAEAEGPAFSENETTPPAEHAAEPPAGEHSQPAEIPPGTTEDAEADAVEHDASKAVPTTVAVIAVVDSFTLLPAGEDEDPVERAAKLDLAQRRERVVRQELQNVLVANTMITVVQPNENQIAAARAEIGATNSAALSNTMLPSLAETLGVQHVVTALCDLEGKEVNVVAQHAPDGTIVFQDTLIDWDVVLAVAEEAAKEKEAAAQ